MDELLKMEHLSAGIDSPGGKVQALRDVSRTLHPGEVLAIVGGSGCGKRILCKAMMKLLPRSAECVLTERKPSHLVLRKEGAR